MPVDQSNPDPDAPPMGEIRTVEMHTGGEPVRIITQGWPAFPTDTSILEKRACARAHHEPLRRTLMWEPRGHFDMYGALLVPPSLPGADLAVLFLHNEGWSTMCGHAVIALGRFAVDEGLVAAQEPETIVRIECPCGLVEARVSVRDGRAGAVSFQSVPSFLLHRDATLALAPYGAVRFDVAYGGAFYALAEVGQFGLDLARSRTRDLVDAATALTEAVRAALPIAHPDAADLSFLYGSILTEGDGRNAPTRNVCVFAQAEVDRSPTGSGVTARLAAMHAKGEIGLNESRVFESLTGARFTGAVVARTRAGPHDAITARVGGQAFYTGRAVFTHEPDDRIGCGFLLR